MYIVVKILILFILEKVTLVDFKLKNIYILYFALRNVLYRMK